MKRHQYQELQASPRLTNCWLLLSLLAACLLASWPAAAQQPDLRSALAEELRRKPAVEELSRTCVHGDCQDGYGVMEIRTPLGKNEYRGNFQNGHYHGYGKLTEMVSRTQRAYYDGQWDQGLRSGRGTYWNGVSDLYIGQWKDDLRHGQGSYFFGLKDWRENRHSEAWLSENVENYTGEFREDLFHGEGVYRWPDGQKYVGGFFANMKHGPGTFYYPRGTTRPQMWEYGELLY